MKQHGGMLRVIVDPRRTPRVKLDLHVDADHVGDLLQAITQDFGPGGCLLVTPRPLIEGAAVKLLLRTPRLRDSLVAEGDVVWRRARQAGIAFRMSEGGDAASWFRRIVEHAPALRLEMGRRPSLLAADDRLYCGRAPRAAVAARGGDEMLVLCAFQEGCAVGALAASVALPPERFSRAVFALLHADLLTVHPLGVPGRSVRAGRSGPVTAGG